MPRTDARTTYAQSSDIKSRTYLEYRRDMKKKAIAELDVLPWLERLIQKERPGAKVAKAGGDKDIWFRREGGITREPDYEVREGSTREEIEFQYAEQGALGGGGYDFKVSKIATKLRGTKQRIPKSGLKVLYVIKSSGEYALLEPAWILRHSEMTTAPAWGNREVYRLPAAKFHEVAAVDEELKAICATINRKNAILEFQHGVLASEEEIFGYLLENVFGEEKILTLESKQLESLYKICFLLDRLKRVPHRADAWFDHFVALISGQATLNARECFQIVYCIDYLYPHLALSNEGVQKLSVAIALCKNKILSFLNEDGSFSSDKSLKPLDDTRYSLFVLNILEDLTQDLIFSYGCKGLAPVTKIFADFPVAKVYDFIQGGSGK